jgi:prepilin-type N-terminal cleavage/methylation domain-containing protein
MAARIRTRFAREEGFTMIELLTTMAILGFVMAGILTLFVGGLRAEQDMNERFQAQQNARLALVSMRRDVRTACSWTAVAASSVTLTEPDAVNGCSSGTTQVTWCASSPSGAPYTLYRQTGATCAYNNGISKVGSLTTNAIFAANPSCSPGVVARPQLGVTLPVDANLASTNGTYTLSDAITLRNATPAVLC